MSFQYDEDLHMANDAAQLAQMFSMIDGKPLSASLEYPTHENRKRWQEYESFDEVVAGFSHVGNGIVPSKILTFPGCYVIHNQDIPQLGTQAYLRDCEAYPIENVMNKKTLPCDGSLRVLDLRPMDHRLVKPSLDAIEDSIRSGHVAISSVVLGTPRVRIVPRSSTTVSNSTPNTMHAYGVAAPVAPGPFLNPAPPVVASLPTLGRSQVCADFYSHHLPLPGPGDQYGCLNEDQYSRLHPGEQQKYEQAHRLDFFSSTFHHSRRKVLPYDGQISLSDYSNLLQHLGQFANNPGPQLSAEGILSCRSLGGFMKSDESSDGYTTFVPWLSNYTINNMPAEFYLRKAPGCRGWSENNQTKARHHNMILKPAVYKPYLNKYGHKIHDIAILPDELTRCPAPWELKMYKMFDDRVNHAMIMERLPDPNGHPLKESWFNETINRFNGYMNFSPWTEKGTQVVKRQEAIREILVAQGYSADASSTRGISSGLIDIHVSENENNRILVRPSTASKYDPTQPPNIHPSLRPTTSRFANMAPDDKRKLKGRILGGKGDIATYVETTQVGHEKKQEKRDMSNMEKHRINLEKMAEAKANGGEEPQPVETARKAIAKRTCRRHNGSNVAAADDIHDAAEEITSAGTRRTRRVLVSASSDGVDRKDGRSTRTRRTRQLPSMPRLSAPAASEHNDDAPSTKSRKRGRGDELADVAEELTEARPNKIAKIRRPPGDNTESLARVASPFAEPTSTSSFDDGARPDFGLLEMPQGHNFHGNHQLNFPRGYSPQGHLPQALVDDLAPGNQDNLAVPQFSTMQSAHDNASQMMFGDVVGDSISEPQADQTFLPPGAHIADVHGALPFPLPTQGYAHPYIPQDPWLNVDGPSEINFDGQQQLIPLQEPLQPFIDSAPNILSPYQSFFSPSPSVNTGYGDQNQAIEQAFPLSSNVSPTNSNGQQQFVFPQEPFPSTVDGAPHTHVPDQRYSFPSPSILANTGYADCNQAIEQALPPFPYVNPTAEAEAPLPFNGYFDATTGQAYSDTPEPSLTELLAREAVDMPTDFDDDSEAAYLLAMYTQENSS